MREYLVSFRRGWEVFKPFRKKFGIMLIMLAVTQVIWQMGPLVFGKLLNSLQAEEPLGTALVFAGVMYLLTLAGISMGWRRAIFQEKNLDYDIERHLAGLTLSRVLGLSIAQHKSQNSGITQGVVRKGQNSLEQMVYLLLYTIIPLVVGIVITLSLLIWFNWPIGMVVLGGVALYVYVDVRNNKQHWPGVKKWNDSGDNASKKYTEILQNTPLVQVNSQEERVRNEHGERLSKWKSEGQAVWIPYILGTNKKHALIFTFKFVVLVACILMVKSGAYKIGDFVIIWSWTGAAISDLWTIAPLQRQWLTQWAQVKKYFAILDVEPAVKVVSNPIRHERLAGKVEFRNVSYTYSDQRYVSEEEAPASERKKDAPYPALTNVSFIIHPGERVAFVGESGAGKSTLVGMLVRGDDPLMGQVLIDDDDLRLLDLKWYRESIGFVEQNVDLFDNTIRYNTLFGLNGRGKDITNDELEKVATEARIDRFRYRLTEGWETRIGEKGVKLSGGERQRVGIARAIVKQPRILILDEATSNLDPMNERMIKEAVRNASAGRTTIIIAHRLSTVRDADRIYVMARGSIVAEGKHEELCEVSPHYRELVHDQLVAL